MLSKIEKVENGYIAHYERHLNHPVNVVWAWLTENDKLGQWFSELHVDKLREGGCIKFNMQDGTFIDMQIFELNLESVLEFAWGQDIVRFELHPESEGCRLLLIEKIKTITNHTPKDLAGWHVCLEVVSALMDGRTVEDRMQVWEKWYEKYSEEVKKFS